MIERLYSLRAAARLLGVSHKTLANWLKESGQALPEIPRGSKLLIPESVLEQLIDKRSPRKEVAA